MAETLEILRRLVAGHVEFVVIGGVAAVAYGSTIATDDVDVCAPMDRENAVKILRAFSDVEPRWRFRPDMPIVTPDDAYLGQLKNIYLRTSLGILDVLGELPGVCGYADVAATSVMRQLDDISCRFISIDLLIAAKRAAGRDHDLRTVTLLEAIQRETRDR